MLAIKTNEYRTYLNLPVGTPGAAGNILVGGGFGRMGGYLTPVIDNKEKNSY